MTQPKTLLEMAGAAPAPVDAADAAVVMIDCQREYLDGHLPLSCSRVAPKPDSGASAEATSARAHRSGGTQNPKESTSNSSSNRYPASRAPRAGHPV